MDVQELIQLYKLDQTTLVVRKRRGDFADQKGYEDEQKRVWRKFLLDRFLITRTQKHLRELCIYYRYIFIKNYVLARDRYWLGQITIQQYKALIKIACNKYEKLFVEEGITLGYSTSIFRLGYAKSAFDFEKSIIIKKPCNIQKSKKLQEICDATTPYGYAYCEKYLIKYKKWQ